MSISVAHAAGYYVSPNGSGLVGSIESPMGLSNALKSGVSPATGGDTIWIRSGTYSGQFTCDLSAASNNPIVIRNYRDERVTVDLTTNAFSIDGSGVWVWGLEFTDTTTDRTVLRNSGVNLNSGATGTANKLINCIVHDLGNAVFVSYQSTNAEVAGCVLYNTGYDLPDRGHGHHLYLQNRSYTQGQLHRENIGLNSFSGGVNLRSSFPVVNIRMLGNVSVNSGSLSSHGRASDFLTEGEPADQLTFERNFTWLPSLDYSATRFSDFTREDGTITLVSNVFANNYTQIIGWTNVVFNGNLQSGHADFRPTTNTLNIPQANFNAYYSMQFSKPVRWTNTELTLVEWQGMGNDLNGSATASNPSGTWAYVRPNPYESGRANIIIYNWDTNDVVSVDVSGVLASGNKYIVRNAADFYGPAVAIGTYGGGNISLPMTNLSVATPVGLSAPAATGQRFNVFVITQSQNSSLNAMTLKIR